MNRLADSNQICMGITPCTLGHAEEVILFWYLDIIFKITVGLKLPNLRRKVLVCLLSHEPLSGMLPNLHVCIYGTGWAAD